MNMRPLAKRCLQCGLLHCFWQIHLWLLSIYFVSEGVVFKEHFFKICTCRFIYLGGSPEAGKERKRQQDLENNYNLVWSDDELQTVPRDDDEADGEVEVESF